MASRKIADSLPPAPPSLKTVTPFLQRAEELKSKDPVMSYWCVYYAAQLGLDQKSHEPGARDFLLALITLLEGMKKELGANDAIDNEPAGAAYVENFALRVFSVADNEDRKGEANRSTAKKFLAAANFLELLKVFERSNNAQVNEEKIRYAKWKASDIAKAIREGRKPSPGSAATTEDGTVPQSPTQSVPSAADSSSVQTPSDNSVGGVPSVNISLAPPADTDILHTPPRKLKQVLPNINVPPPEISSPGNWSTVATPGSDVVGLPSSMNMGFTGAVNRWKGVNDSDGSPVKPKAVKTVGSNGNGVMRSTLNESHITSTSADVPLKKVHFSPSVVGGLSSTDGSPPPSPGAGSVVFTTAPSQPIPSSSSNSKFLKPLDVPPSKPIRVEPAMTPLPDSSPSNSPGTSPEGTSPPRSGGSRISRSSLGNKDIKPVISHDNNTKSSGLSSRPPIPQPPTSTSPTSASFTSIQSTTHSRQSSRLSPSQVAPTYSIPPPPPPQSNASFASTTSTFVPPTPAFIASSDSSHTVDGISKPGIAPKFLAGPASATNVPPPAMPVAAPVVPAAAPPPRLELTPLLIAKAQKHCRYAISSLEYEDAEQARKELLAALAVLDGR